MDEELVKSAPPILACPPLTPLYVEYSSQVERTGWILVLWGMLTQVSNFGFPSYNVALGFWGTYCAFSKHGRATFGCVDSLSLLLSLALRYICFLFLSIFLDIIFASVYGPDGRGPTFNFALTMLIFALFTKVPPSLSRPALI
jgi:hypothetical protein